jgi:hypothetical protein
MQAFIANSGFVHILFTYFSIEIPQYYVDVWTSFFYL